MMLEALPGESRYKTAVVSSFDEEELVELSQRSRKGFGPWSHLELLVAELIDRVGVLASGRTYEEVPERYPRPGIVPKRKRDSQARAVLLAIAQEHADLHGYVLNPETGCPTADGSVTG